MKIAFVSTEKLPVPPVSGGAVQIYIEGVLPYLRQKHEITVFTVEHPVLSNDEVVDGVHYVRVNGTPKQSYIGNVLEQLDDRFDLVHVFNRPKWVKLISDRLPTTKISLSLHNEMFKPVKISGKEAEECINRVNFICTVSKFVANGVEKLYPEARKKLKVIYSGADLKQYKTAWSKEGIDNRRRLAQQYDLQGWRVILFVGRVNRKKGVDVLIKAIEKVKHRYSKTALLVIGSNWFGENEETDYLSELRKQAQKADIRIVFTGFLTPDKVCAHYNLADVFVCPSQWSEPLARVHYEAMAAGVPLVTTNRGGNAEVVKGLSNGLIVNNYSNPDSLAIAINYLLRNPQHAARLGRNGRVAVERRFNFENTARGLAREFDNCVQQQWKGSIGAW